MIEVRLNGNMRSISSGLNLKGLLAELGVSAQAVIIEKNGEVIKRERFEKESIENGDMIELIQMMGGG